ncbi:MAG: DNA-binding response regulator [Spirochaetaceae bacterium]|nr:MAG: DNA-binding response regulator [Spirochaetaceae bacterium]
MNGRVLVVDDEADIVDVLCFALESAGYQTRATGRGDEALVISREWNPDLVVLDIGLPGLSGLEVCPRLTAAGIPVLVLSSHDRDDEVVEGLEVGAEDYVTKPFNHKELLLRIGKIIRRTKAVGARSAEANDILTAGDITVDLPRREVRVGGHEVHLTPTEFGIIALLARNPGQPVDVETLLREVWGTADWTNGDEMVKVNIRRLRKKIEPDPQHPRYLLNRWGQGYLLADRPSSAE